MSNKNLNIEIIGFKDIEMPVPFFYTAILEFKYNGESMSMPFFSDLKHPNEYKKENLIENIRMMMEAPESTIYVVPRDE